MRILLYLFLWLLPGLFNGAIADVIDIPIKHDLKVTLQPDQQSLQVSDTITLPENSARQLTMVLHAGLQPRVVTERGESALVKLVGNAFVEKYRLKLPANTQQFTVLYQGRIHHQLESSRKEQARGFRGTAGLIDQQGVFLSAGTYWYPQFDQYPYLTFDLKVILPENWRSISQGQRVLHPDQKQTFDHWQLDKPQEEIYLIAAEFTEYSRSTGAGKDQRLAQVFLRQPDSKLANKYLEATIKYIKMYEQLIGPYAYGKFALVENFWETGFGMPSFTLLGSKVIRLPFILNSSYPHEILHNWWGNGVYVDFSSGNWSEGLTAYLADHLIKQQQGQGSNYRQQSLQKYRDYAAKNRDFPLSQFKGRHSSATEAVGYGKTLMMFHMLRNRVGDDIFIKALQKFYQDFQFKIASFSDLQQIFSEFSGQDLSSFFKQWVTRSGSPELSVSGVEVLKQDKKYRLEFDLDQAQAGDAYQLQVPVAITLKGQPKAFQTVVSMFEKQQHYQLELDAEPLRIDIDPEFDLFRHLALAETPPAFTQLFGSSDLLVVLPRNSSSDMQKAWQAFARDVSNMGPEKVSVTWDDEISSLPDDKASVVLGWDNQFSKQLKQELSLHDIQFQADKIRVGLSELPTKHNAFAFVTRTAQSKQPQQKTQPRALITADMASALPGLGRKLPHYHKYSYLGFAGEEPQNQLKGRWSVTDSPMTVLIDPNAQRARLETAPALIEAESSFDSVKMMQTIRFLSEESLQGRGFGSQGLEQAAQFIARSMQQAGLKPGGDQGGYLQSFKAVGGKPRQEVVLNNIIGVIPGTHPVLSKQNLVIGAHYDHLGLGWPDARENNQGKIHQGADDNASGVAVLLELARVLGKNFKPDRTVIFVAFSAEEAGRLGSKYYVQNSQKFPVTNSIGMLNLDTVGRLFKNKLMVLGAESASEWPHIFRGIGFVTGIQSIMVSEPLDASDQVSFHEAGVPAVQLFSGPHLDYHRPGDTIDKIDAEGLVKIAEVTKQVIDYLSSREEVLNNQLAGIQGHTSSKKKRKVSLGTIPDFTYQGEGYRLEGVVPGSPAESAGLRQHDIIVKINKTEIKGLRDVSRVLKTLEPGQIIHINYQREDQILSTEAALKNR